MNESHVIVANYTISKSWQLFFDSFNLRMFSIRFLLWQPLVGSFWLPLVQCLSKCLEQGVRFYCLGWCNGCSTLGETSNNPGSADGAMDDGDDWAKFRFEDTVKVFTSSHTDKTIGIGELWEYSNVVRVFELTTVGHAKDWRIIFKIIFEGIRI